MYSLATAGVLEKEKKILLRNFLFETENVVVVVVPRVLRAMYGDLAGGTMES